MNIPTDTFGLVTFGLLVAMTVILFFMVMYKWKFTGMGLSIMKEGSKWHTFLYFLLFAMALAATVLVCN